MIKVSFHTFGCKCNLSDSNDMALSLLEQGPFSIREGELTANIHIINTCTVTSSADSQARNLIRKLDKLNKGSLIVVSGCSLRNSKKTYEELFNGLSLNNKYEAFDNLKQDIRCVVADFVSLDQKGSPFDSNISSVFRTRALIKIQDGCNSFCSYCIVPHVRGREKSRPQTQIIEEINRLYSQGIKEAVITGINIGSYELGLESLLEKIILETKMPRIRLSSLRPSKLTPKLIELMTEKRICPHLHISLQSGSDRILKLMNRHDYVSSDFNSSAKRYFEALKARSPFMATDVIVGFPGENNDDFEQTYKVINDSQVNKLHVFIFSPRPGTKAFEAKNMFDPIEAKKRSAMLLKLSKQKYLASLNEMVGKTVEVLWEDDTSGHTENYYPVIGQGKKNTLELKKVINVDQAKESLILLN